MQLSSRLLDFFIQEDPLMIPKLILGIIVLLKQPLSLAD